MSERKDLVIWQPPIRKIIELQPGTSIQAAYDLLPEYEKNPALCAFRRGQLIEREDWRNHYLYQGEHVVFAMVPQGGGKKGKGIIGTIAAIALIVAGAVTGQAWMIQIGAGLLISSVGSMLIKPPSLNSNMSGTAERDSSYYGITGQSNEAKPYQVIPKLYGMHRMYPVLASAPIITNRGSTSTIAALYDFGVGMYDLSDMRIGETPASTFSPSFIYHYNDKNPKFSYVTAKVNTDQMQFVLQKDQPLILQSDDNAAQMEIDLVFARGLAYYNDQGNIQSTTVTFTCDYRPVGSTEWIPVGPDKVHGMAAGYISGQAAGTSQIDFIDPQGYTRSYPRDPYSYFYNWRGQTFYTSNPPDGTYGFTDITLSKGGTTVLPGTGGYPLRVQAMAGQNSNTGYTGFVITGATAKPSVASIVIGGLTGGKYEFRITRLTEVSTSTRRIDEATITQFKTLLYGNVVNLRVPHTMVEMSVVGSEKLSGVVQNLNALAISVLYTFDRYGNWVSLVPTRNPAWIAIDILFGGCNPRPLQWHQIDWASWYELAVYCDTLRTWTTPTGPVTGPRFQCDIVIDYQATVMEVVDSVLSGCHATRSMTSDGKWGVIIDERDYFVPRQLVTQTNSWNFSAKRTFPEDVHAFIVSFVDASNEYQKQDVICYRDGYNSANATKFENLGTYGITDWWHAWAFGRYMMAQAIARQELFTLTMDVDNLAFGRGDGVMVQQDVAMIGGYPVKVVSGGNGGAIRVATQLPAMPVTYTVRQRNGTVRSGTVLQQLDSDTIVLDSSVGIFPDDTIVLGENANVPTTQFIVLDINPSQDYTATITLVRYVDEMYDSDMGLLPAWDPTWGTGIIDQTNLAITSVTQTSDVRYVNRDPVETFYINFKVNNLAIYGYAEAFLLVSGFPEQKLGRITTYSFQHVVNLLTDPMAVSGKGTIRIEPYTAGGLLGKPGFVDLIAHPDRVAPQPVKNFAVNVQSETIVLFWQITSEPDVSKHEIRYHPDPVNGSWEFAQQIGIFDWWVTTASCGARTGKYFIRSIDTSGNRSAILWQRTTVEKLPDIDIVLHIDEPTFPGKLQNMTKVNGHPELNGAYGSVVPEGWYYFQQQVDLGSIYEVRVSSKILGHATSSYSYMAQWKPIATRSPLAQGYTGWWNVVLEVRASNTATVMADWDPLSTAVPIGGSKADSWTAWRPIQVGDVTGRFLQFRIHAQSYDPDIKTVIDQAMVDIDVKERRWFLNDQAIPSGGKAFVYDPPFQKVPTLAITTNGGTATRYEITNKTRLGFTVKLFDGATAVAGNIDIAAIGYGKEQPAVI